MSVIPAMIMATSAACLVGNGNVQSDMTNIGTQNCNNKNIIVQQQNIGNKEELKELLKEKGVCVENWHSNNCKPENNLPGGGNTGTEKPGTGQPGTGQPDNGETSDSSYAAKVVDLVNQERANAGLEALSMDKKTADAAFTRAQEIKQLFSHTRPDGSSFTTALKEKNVSYRTAGENIAWGQRTPEEVVKGWMNSEGHRANILSKDYTSIGVGHYENNGTSYWVQLFTS